MLVSVSEIERLLSLQDGVVARRQLVECGLADHDIRRMLRRRELAVMHPGVYVNHTGAPSSAQMAWAAVLLLWPAALTHASAVVAPVHRGKVHVALERNRSVTAPTWVRVHYVADLTQHAQWNLSPPRVRLEVAVLDLVASATTEMEAIAVLADAVGSRRTTADRLRSALADRKRMRRRKFVEAVLADVAAGSCSVLEQRYLRLVERAHGLPGGRRQVKASAKGTIYRDVVHEDFGVVVELDGRVHDHLSARDADLTRDLAAALEQLLTLRIGWGQVVGTPCETAWAVGQILQSRGWTGEIRRCPRCRDASLPPITVAA